ncbi:MAG: hypothetical protein DI538_10395 [Azospira oryzae]|jgi:hypothetical protein|nr:MAG: hypothetical protein DI538_10395 [Azospira oryzae]
MQRVVLLVFCGSIFFSSAYSQDIDTLQNQYVKNLGEYFFIGPVLKKRALTFGISAQKDGKNKVSFTPNNAYSIGLNMNIFDLGLEASMSVPLDVKSVSRYGKSEVKDLQVSAVSRRFLADAYWQKYTGFYYTYPGLNIKADQPFPQRPDIAARNFGASFGYVFNHRNFSMRSAYTFLDQQLKSNGSALLGFIVSSFDIRGDSAITPVKLRQNNAQSSIDEIRFTSLGIAPGYSYNLVYKNFFVNATLLLGPAHYWIRYHQVTANTRNDIEINLYTSGRFALGYNGNRVFSGLSYTWQARSVAFENLSFTNSINTLRFDLGFRFRERGILKKRAVDVVPQLLKKI